MGTKDLLINVSKIRVVSTNIGDDKVLRLSIGDVCGGYFIHKVKDKNINEYIKTIHYVMLKGQGVLYLHIDKNGYIDILSNGRVVVL